MLGGGANRKSKGPVLFERQYCLIGGVLNPNFMIEYLAGNATREDPIRPKSTLHLPSTTSFNAPASSLQHNTMTKTNDEEEVSVSSLEKEGIVHNPRRRDVLLGRGNHANHHWGNIRFRNLVKERLDEYLTSTYFQARDTIARQIIEELIDEGTRFLRETEHRNSSSPSRAWEVANRETVIPKVKQAFRDAIKQKNSKKKSQEVANSRQELVRIMLGKQVREQQQQPQDLPVPQFSSQPAVAGPPPPTLDAELTLLRLQQQIAQQQAIVQTASAYKNQQQQQQQQEPPPTPTESSDERRQLYELQQRRDREWQRQLAEAELLRDELRRQAR